MNNYTTKTVKDFCYNCYHRQNFLNTYLNGRKVETVCMECDEVDTFPLDDED